MSFALFDASRDPDFGYRLIEQIAMLGRAVDDEPLPTLQAPLESEVFTADRADFPERILVLEALKMRRQGIYRAAPAPLLLTRMAASFAARVSTSGM